jgi:hypothetical protein
VKISRPVADAAAPCLVRVFGRTMGVFRHLIQAPHSRLPRATTWADQWRCDPAALERRRCAGNHAGATPGIFPSSYGRRRVSAVLKSDMVSP